MTWFRCGGGSGMPADLKNRMNAVFNKKFGTAVDYPPEGWPDDVNLMGPLPEKTIVSSPIADFSDGADDVPTKSLVVTIPPTLSGVSSVSVTQTGRNVLNPSFLSLFSSSKYLGTSNYNSEGTIDILGGENYVISFAFTITDGRVRYWDAEGNQISNVSLSNKQSLALTTPSNAVKMSFYAGQNTAQTSVTDFEPMLEYGTTETTYEPYQTPTTYTASLGRTIYGGEVDVVNGTAEPTNWFNVADYSQIYTDRDGIDAYSYRYMIIHLKPNTTYTVSQNSGEAKSTPIILINSVLPVGGSNYLDLRTASGSKTYTTGDDGYLYIGSVNSYDDVAYARLQECKVQIEEGSTASEYTPYFEPFTFTGQEIPTRLGYNAFWSDEGDTEVTYRADLDLALQAVSNNRGLMMASRPAIEPANGDQGSEESTENNIETEGEQDAR